MLINDIMTPGIESVAPDVSLREAARKMRESDIGALPVMEKGELIGMITDRDICCRAVAEGLDPTTTSVRDIMSKGVTCCYADQEVSEAAHLMEDRHVRRLAVLNRDKRIVGFLSVDDVARWAHDLAGEVLAAGARVTH